MRSNGFVNLSVTPVFGAKEISANVMRDCRVVVD